MCIQYIESNTVLVGYTRTCNSYPAAAHAQSGVKQSGPSVCLCVCLSVNRKILKCVLNARYTALAASKEHVDKENRTYFTSIMPQDQYGSIPCRSNLSIYTVYTGNRLTLAITSLRMGRDVFVHAHMKSLPRGNVFSEYSSCLMVFTVYGMCTCMGVCMYICTCVLCSRYMYIHSLDFQALSLKSALLCDL